MNESLSSNEHSTFDDDLLESQEVTQLHPQELGHGRMKGSSNHLGELARNGSWLHEMLCL